MRRRRVVHTVLGSVALVCCATALVVFPLSVLVALGLGALTGVCALAVAHGRLHPDPPHHRRRALVAGLHAGGSVAAAVLVVTGAAVVLGSATVPALLLVAVGAAAWVWWRRAELLARCRPCPVEPGPAPTGTEDRSPDGAAAVTDRRSLASLPTPAVCARWQAGYHALRRHPPPRLRDTILRSRRECLDELERRDPDGVARWLAAETRPGSTSPHRYLTQHPIGRPGAGGPACERGEPPHGSASADEIDGSGPRAGGATT